MTLRTSPIVSARRPGDHEPVVGSSGAERGFRRSRCQNARPAGGAPWTNVDPIATMASMIQLPIASCSDPRRRRIAAARAGASVESIHIATGAGAPMRSVDRVRAIAGVGLEGDRYAIGTGHYSGDPRSIATSR